MSRMSPPRSTSSFSKCGSASDPIFWGVCGLDTSYTDRPRRDDTYISLPRKRAEIPSGSSSVASQLTFWERSAGGSGSAWAAGEHARARIRATITPRVMGAS
jgi:hypothetical protein